MPLACFCNAVCIALWLCCYGVIGKAFSYFASKESWIKEVLYHKVSDDSRVCLLKTSCTPSQRISQIPHKLWVCIHKKSGAIEKAYCTCLAGLLQVCKCCPFMNS